MRQWLGSVAALCLLAATSAASEGRTEEARCDPLALELTLVPQRTPNYASLKETLRVQASRPERADIVLLGDSLLAGWRTDLPATFPSTAIYDFAVGGDRVQNLLWRLEKTDLSHLRPSAAVLLIGTNDLAAGTPACAVIAGIHAVVDRLRNLWPETPLLVLTIPPRGADFQALDDPRLEVNGAIVALGVRSGLVHAVAIDDNAFTCGQYGKGLPAGAAPPARLSCGFYADDNLHFSTEGYVELGRMLDDAALRAIGEDVFR